jgi:hypothetical protein
MAKQTLHRVRIAVRLFSLPAAASLLLAVSAHAATKCYPPPKQMVSWWPGDGNAKDIVGKNNGKLKNGAGFAKGYVKQAFSLNGTNQYVDLGNAKSLWVSKGAFTVDAWVYFNNIGEPDQSIVDKMNANGTNSDGWRLLYQGDFDQFWFCLGGGPGNNGCQSGAPTTVVSTTTVKAQTWYHVTGVKTSTTISIYVNGSLEGTSQFGTFTDTNSTDLLFGVTASQGKTAWLNGLIDEVELFKRALKPAEIQGIYGAGHAGKCKGK